MILISIQPFAPKKLFALAATIACLSTASCFADAMYLSAKSEGSARPVRQTRAVQTTQARADVSVMVSDWDTDLIACAK